MCGCGFQFEIWWRRRCLLLDDDDMLLVVFVCTRGSASLGSGEGIADIFPHQELYSCVGTRPRQ
jgi:hypothetical protein